MLPTLEVEAERVAPQSSPFSDTVLTHSPKLIMKPVAHLTVDRPRIVVVKSPKRQTVVQLHPPICHIQRGHETLNFSPKFFPTEMSNVVCCGK